MTVQFHFFSFRAFLNRTLFTLHGMEKPLHTRRHLNNKSLGKGVRKHLNCIFLFSSLLQFFCCAFRIILHPQLTNKDPNPLWIGEWSEGTCAPVAIQLIHIRYFVWERKWKSKEKQKGKQLLFAKRCLWSQPNNKYRFSREKARKST